MKTSNSKTELRIYQPSVGKAPGALFQDHIGKMVTVRWAAPVFTQAEPDHRGNPRWLVKWFGYVAEFGQMIPGEYLIPLLKPFEGEPHA